MAREREGEREREGGKKSAERDIFNMHRKERNKSVREFSAFFECCAPATRDKTGKLMWPLKIMSTRQEMQAAILGVLKEVGGGDCAKKWNDF